MSYHLVINVFVFLYDKKDFRRTLFSMKMAYLNVAYGNLIR